MMQEGNACLLFQRSFVGLLNSFHPKTQQRNTTAQSDDCPLLLCSSIDPANL